MRLKSLPALALGMSIGAVVTYGIMRPEGGTSGPSAVAGRGRQAHAPEGQNLAEPAALSGFPAGFPADATWQAALEAGGEKRQEALRSKMVEILGMPHLSKRKRLFGAMLECYQPGDLEAIHRGMMDREKMGGRFDEEFEMMMERAAEVDGPEVIRRIEKESLAAGSKMHDWQSRCVANWAAAASPQAIDWWNQLPNGRFRDQFARPVIEGVSRVNPELAWKAAQVFDPDQRSRFAANLVTQFANTRGLDEAVGWVAGLGADETGSKINALRELTTYMHQIPPAKQAELYGRFASEPWVEGSGVFEGVAKNWARRNGEEAAAWAQTLPESIRGAASMAALGKWTEKNPAAAGQWLLEHQEGPEFAPMASAFLHQLEGRQAPDLEEWRARLSLPAEAGP